MLATLAAALVLGSGLTGTVFISPALPVCRSEAPCTAPDPHDLLVFSRGGRRVAAVTTHADGTFRVSLAPGLYRVTLPRKRGRVTPSQVLVPRGRFAHVLIDVDIGIR